MKALVAVKRVVDPYVKIRVNPDGSGVNTQHLKMSMNPFDEIALEEAIRLREKNIISEITAVTIGDDSSQETLRHALALGADNALLILSERTHCSLNISKILHAIVIQKSPSVVLMGKQSIDGDNNQTPQMLAALLDWPQATFASKVEINGEKARVTRETDSGLETIEVTLPAVISSDLRLNEPRYASLPNIMKAKRKPLEIISLDELNLSLKNHVEIIKLTSPEERRGGIKVSSVAELLDKLRNEAKVL